MEKIRTIKKLIDEHEYRWECCRVTHMPPMVQLAQRAEWSMKIVSPSLPHPPLLIILANTQIVSVQREYME
jgi:uncharacterized protein YueI